MKKVLILGEGISTHRILKEIKGKYKIFVCGKKENNLKFSKDIKHIKIDYKDKEKTLYKIKKFGIDYIIPDGNDISYVSSSFIANKLNLIGFEKFNYTKMIHDKFLISKKLSKFKFYPRIFSAREINKDKKNFFPIIFRPRITHSGINIKKINSLSEYRDLLKKNFFKNGIFNKFIKGKLFSHSFFINGNETLDFFVKENQQNFKVTLSEAPFLINDKEKKKIRKISNIIKDEFKLKGGLLHIQYLFNGKNYFFIEACRRCPGDFYGDLIRKAFKYNYYKNYANFFLGKKVEKLNNKRIEKFYRKTIFFKKELVSLKKKRRNFNFFKSYQNYKKNQKIGVAIYK